MQEMTIQSQTGHSHACIVPEQGGYVSSLVLEGVEGEKERLFLESFESKDSQGIPGGLLFCFPICGRLMRQNRLGDYIYRGKTYFMDIHGFAWQKAWQVKLISSDFMILLLESNEDTLKQYPFHFELYLKYSIRAHQFRCQWTLQNYSHEPMPYYAGFHPYFLTPKGSDKAKVAIDFPSRYRYQYDSTLTDIIGHLPPASMPIFINPEINDKLHVIEGENRFVLFYPNGDQLHAKVQSEEPHLFPYLQLYTRDNEPFICVEPWMGQPNAMNSVEGVRWLAPKKIENATMLLSLNPNT